jgi:hypothetical protein
MSPPTPCPPKYRMLRVVSVVAAPIPKWLRRHQKPGGSSGA